MTDWTDGYVADVGYTYGYYSELNPLRAQWAFLYAGLEPPPLPPEGGTACELGFGQGVSAAFHAAGSTVQWWGTDFNPAQAAHAIQLARASGVKASFHDQAFAEFCCRDDLPDFDSIGLHGIWSWISDENRKVVVDFVRRKLKVGGVLYISYNTQPGWSAAMPLRHLLTSHAALMGSAGQGILGRIDDSIRFAEKFMAANPSYLRANPSILDRLTRLKTLDKAYIAHEYFNRAWDPMHFAQMDEWLAPAKVSFACSAHLLDQIDAINLTPEQQQIVKDLPAGTFRETVRDYCVNQQFRRDYWVKGARRINQVDQAELLSQMRVVLVQSPAKVSLKAQSPSGEVSLKPEVYLALLDALSDHEPRSVEYVSQRMHGKGFNPAQTREALMVLVGTGALQLCQNDAIAKKVRPQTDRLNAHLMNQARAGGIGHLVSPLIGGHAVTRSEQLFLLARSRGLKTLAEWARFAWDVYNLLGQRLIKDGKIIESAEDNVAELERQATEFKTARLPILKALQIA